MNQLSPSSTEKLMLDYAILQLAIDVLDNPNFDAYGAQQKKALATALMEIEPVLNRLFNLNEDLGKQRHIWKAYREASRNLEAMLLVNPKVPTKLTASLRVLKEAAEGNIENIDMAGEQNMLAMIEQYEEIANRMRDITLISLRISEHKMGSKVDAALDRLVEKYELHKPIYIND